ncbi:XRE family transcriptional regulator [Streptococcus suis]
MNDEKKYFASNLKFLRQKKGMEQLELANLLGRKSSSSISEWEKGRYTPKSGILSDIASIFNVSLSDLMETDLTTLSSISQKVEVIPSTVNKITATASQLEHKRQLIVLDTAEKQLEEQKLEAELKSKQPNKPQKGIVSELFEQRRKEQLAEEEKEKYAVEGITATAAASGLGRGYGYDDSDTYTVYTDERPPKTYTFATMVKGDSMMPKYKEGDMLYLHDKGISSYSGILAVVAYGDRTYFKKIYTENEILRLVSLNDKYDDIILDFPPSEDTHIRIFEVVGSFTPIET